MFLGDYHTHTRYSDGKGTVEQTLAAADARGLLQVGISDHGMRHILNATKADNIAQLRRDVDRLRGKYKVQPLISVEANIYASDGRIDLKESDRGMFDYIVAGYHKAPWPASIKEMFTFNLPAMVANKFGEYTNSQRDKYTKTMVAAIKNGRFNILSHLNYGIPSHVKEVGKAALDYNVMLELNGKRINMTDEEIMTLYDMGVTFIVNSDGHSPERIGDMSVPMAVIERLGLDKSRLANWDKLPELTLR